MNIVKQDSALNASSDTSGADLRDKYNTLILENKSLQRQLNDKFNAEKLSTD